MFNSIQHVIQLVVEKHIVLRYAVSGGLASAIDLLVLYTFTEFFGLYYLGSAIIAAGTSFVVRFILQKMFTFKNQSVYMLPRQLVFYSALSLGAAGASILLLYFFVEVLHVWYMLGQAMTIILVAAGSFFIYRHIIFPEPQP